MTLSHPARNALFAVLVAGLTGCYSTSTGPCASYCDYICACEGDTADTASLSCADCATIYSDEDPALQDECETALADRQNADHAAGYECSTDTGAAP